MFGSRDSDGDHRVLVTAEEHIPEDVGVSASEDLNLNDGGQSMSYHDLVAFARRKKYMIAFIGTGVTLLFVLIVATVCVTVKANSAPVIDPTTPAPMTTTSTTTKPTTTTTSTTTSKPTTTTTSTTTSTTSKPTTTTTSTTTSTTSKPTTTTTTSTTTSTTTELTTTTSTTTPTTTTHSPPAGVPTSQPLPPHPESLPAITLIYQVFLHQNINFSNINCTPAHPPTFKYALTIKGISGIYIGESDRIENAKKAASQKAAEAIFGIHYFNPMPPPPQPCGDTKTSLIEDINTFRLDTGSPSNDNFRSVV